MKQALNQLRQFTERRPVAIGILLVFITLFVDFTAGREIRFPLFYIVPIAMIAWLGRSKLAYVLSILLPVVRVAFESVWQIPESVPVELLNAFFESLALFFYVYLVSRQALHTRQMKNTITTQQDSMQHLRAFTRMIGTTLQGRGISPGLSDGVTMCYMPGQYAESSGEHILRKDVDAEIARFGQAMESSINELHAMLEKLAVEPSDQTVVLLEMRIVMLSDPSLADGCRRRIAEDLIRAEDAVIAEVQRIENMFESPKQKLMPSRIADVRDIGHQLLRKLGTIEGDAPHQLASLPSGTVLVAEELMLSDALQMDMANVVAIVTERTGPASHVAMLARTRGIPAVCDIRDATSLLPSGIHLLVDAEVGTVTVAPTPTQEARFALRKVQSAPFVHSKRKDAAEPCMTADGLKIELLANIARADEVAIVQEHHLDGVGLFRSEFLFLQAERPPDMAAQATAYSMVAARMNPRPVVIRTMDLGGDKVPQFTNPESGLAARAGLRGLAYSLTEKEMFRTQIQAIIKAAENGNVSLMFPMVMGTADLNEARCLVEDILQHTSPGQSLAIGAMIETPAAVFDIHEILKVADFVSIGTNDLAHSILAMDRGTQGHAGVASFLHPSVLRATNQIIIDAREQGVSVSVCGEAASDPAAACLLIGMGVRSLSVNPFLEARVRHAIRQVTLNQMQTSAEEVLVATTTKDVRNILAAMLHDNAL